MTYVIHRYLHLQEGINRPLWLGNSISVDNGIASILANLSEGVLFENAIFNQLRNYGTLNYLLKGMNMRSTLL